MSDETFMMGASPMAPPAPAPTQPAPTQPAPANAGSGTARRTVLAGVGVVAAGALGYAVGFGGQLTRPEEAAARDSAAQDSSAQDKAQTDVALVAVADVPAGGGTVVKDAKVVVTKDQRGQVRAFSAICTHQGCTVASVSGGTINCPCHGSNYNASDGSVKNGPATQPLPAKNVTVSGDTLTVT